MDVNSSAKWDFLAPWCKELKGQLISIPSGFIRVIGPRTKRRKPLRLHWEEEEEGDGDGEKVDPEEEKKKLEECLRRTRESIELLSLVAKVDQRAFHMLVTEQCGLELDDDESDEEEEEEEEFVPMLPWEGGMGYDLIESDDDEDGEEQEEVAENEEENDGDRRDEESSEGEAGENQVEDEDEDGRYVSDEEQYQEVLVVNPDIFKKDWRPERETFISPRFDFIALSGFSGTEDPTNSVKEWEEFFLAEAPQYQPSDAYKKAKACILQMLDANWSRIPRSLEIPISLEFGRFAATAEDLAGYFSELSSLIEAMKYRADKIRAESAKPQKVTDCAQTVTFTVVGLSLSVNNKHSAPHFLAERVLELVGGGVPIGEFHMYLAGQTDTAGVANHEALAKLLSGMLIRPLSSKQQLPSFTDLQIDCENSALWEFEALCSALSISQVSIGNLQLSGVCNDHKKDELRQKFWRLVAQTFFRPKSCTRGPVSPVSCLDLTDIELNSDDLAEITAVLHDKEHQEMIAQQWDICQKRWLLRENSLVQFIEKEGDNCIVVAGDPVRLPYDYPVQLVDSDNDADESSDDSQSHWLDVVIPAFGRCRVPRGSVIAGLTKDGDNTGKRTREPLSSLSLSCESDIAGLEGLLKLIGWSLHTVSLTFHHEVNVNAIIPTILQSCPKLTELSLGESYIDLDQFATLYEGMWSPDDGVALSSLKFEDFYGIGEGEGMQFMKLLGDPTSRLAKHLLELALMAGDGAEPLGLNTLGELWMALEKSTRLEKVEVVMAPRTTLGVVLKQRLLRLNGQVLPPRPLNLPCKLAFLSVARPADSNDDKALPAVERLDQQVLSLIFAFAATRVVRYVKVYGE